MNFNFKQSRQGQNRQGRGGQVPFGHRLRKAVEQKMVANISKTAQNNGRVRSPLEIAIQHAIFSINDAVGCPPNGVLNSVYEFAASQGRGISDIEQVGVGMLKGLHHCLLQRVEAERNANSTNLLPEVIAWSVRPGQSSLTPYQKEMKAINLIGAKDQQRRNGLEDTPPLKLKASSLAIRGLLEDSSVAIRGLTQGLKPSPIVTSSSSAAKGSFASEGVQRTAAAVVNLTTPERSPSSAPASSAVVAAAVQSSTPVVAPSSPVVAPSAPIVAPCKSDDHVVYFSDDGEKMMLYEQKGYDEWACPDTSDELSLPSLADCTSSTTSATGPNPYRISTPKTRNQATLEPGQATLEQCAHFAVNGNAGNAVVLGKYANLYREKKIDQLSDALLEVDRVFKQHDKPIL